MNKIKNVFRLYFSLKLSQRTIAKSLRLSLGVVNKYIQMAEQAKLPWPLPDDTSDSDLLSLLQPAKRIVAITQPINAENKSIDLAQIHCELKRKHVTLQLLWEEYLIAPPGEKSYYSYSQFCRLYNAWRQKQSLSMRQIHKAGDKLFIDYSGDTVPINDRLTGEIRQAEIFVAVLGASNYTYADATWTQTLPDWIGSHVRVFRYLGGVTALLVPDNLKSAITKFCRYEPNVNRTYDDLALHYDTAILPARPLRPKDKAKVEVSVLIVQRWILARLRNYQFFSLEELNTAIKKLLFEINNKPFKKLPGTRYSQFVSIDKPALKPLPETDYEYAKFKIARVNRDYHVEIDKHYYSAPYLLVREEVDVRWTSNCVELFHNGQRVAIHRRSTLLYTHTTCDEHMPKSHQHYAGYSPESFLDRAMKIGSQTRRVVQNILVGKKHIEQSYRAAQGLLRLAKNYSPERLEKACDLALAIGSPNRRSVLSILEKGLEQSPLEQEEAKTDSVKKPPHENIRGSDYYTSSTDKENTHVTTTHSTTIA